MATTTVQSATGPTAQPAGLQIVRDDICRNAAREIAAIASLLRGRLEEAGDLEYLLRGSLMRVEALADAITFGVRSDIKRNEIAESYEAVYGEKLLVLLGEPLEVAHA